MSSIPPAPPLPTGLSRAAARVVKRTAASAINRIIRAKMKKLNRNLDWPRLSLDVGLVDPDEVRSFVVNIRGSNLIFPFEFRSSQIVWLTQRPQLHPTTEITMPMAAWKSLLLGKLTPDEIYVDPSITVATEHFLRQKLAADILFRVMFTDEGYEEYRLLAPPLSAPVVDAPLMPLPEATTAEVSWYPPQV